MPDETQPNRKLIIRKYPNRRYYDTTRSQHVTLEEIHALIRDGNDIQVTDSRSGKDITGKVLAQIIIELDPPKLDVFPAPLLHKLLRSSEQLVTDFVQKYFNEALDSFLDSQRNMEQVMRSAMGLSTTPPTVADIAKIWWAPLKNAPWAPGMAAPAGAPQPANSASEEDLRTQIQQLNDELARLRGNKKKPRRGSKPKH